MEMPVDILTHRLGKLVDSGALQANDYTAIALDIDLELQRKFYVIPKEEVNNVEIMSLDDGLNYMSQAGSGPETIRGSLSDNPAWLYNSAVNALAMMQHIQREQDEARARERRPEPGVYNALHPGGRNHFAVIVTNDRRIVVPMQLGDMCDQTDIFDEFANKGTPWLLQRIDVMTGTIEKKEN